MRRLSKNEGDPLRRGIDGDLDFEDDLDLEDCDLDTEESDLLLDLDRGDTLYFLAEVNFTDLLLLSDEE